MQQSYVALESRVQVRRTSDIVTAREHGRRLAKDAGFSSGEQTLVATAISELARNIVTYAKYGEVRVRVERQRGQPVIVVVAEDQGPGIADIEAALRDGYSTSNSMGLGLPGTRRLMDEFEIISAPGKGTTVITKKWRW